MKKGKNSAIRALEHKADSGNIKAAFQLYEYYKYEEENKGLSHQYGIKTLKLFKNDSLKISFIKFINFRAFQSAEFRFCQSGNNLTVIVGINGSGKTALLDGLSKSLSWLIQRVRYSAKTSGKNIEYTDIHKGSEYASIITGLSVNDAEYELELSKVTQGSNLSRKGDHIDIGQLARIYKFANEQNEKFNLPIMVYYSVDRSLDISKKDNTRLHNISKKQKKGQNKFEGGYDSSLNGTADFMAFFIWFKTWKYIETSDDISLKEKATRYLQITLNAIETFMPEIKNLRMSISMEEGEDMLIDKGQTTLSVWQLSQGEKSLLAMVADITRRLIFLNPSLSNPLKGGGVVLIDEVDLHLHPRWQQEVVPKLLRTFSNIQFIITTHSPQVLSTVPKESIRVLDKNSDGKIVVSTPIAYSYGEPSNDIMQAIMHVDPQPPIREKEWLKRLTVLVDQGLYDKKEAVEIREKLEQSLNKDHPQLKRIDRSIRRQREMNK